MNHRWSNNKCLICGLKRKLKHYRSVTALKNKEVYVWYYGKKYNFKRPECVGRKESLMDKKFYRKRWCSTELEIILPRYDEVKIINEEKLYVQKRTCSQFGCSKILTYEEKLFGDKCEIHSKPGKINNLASIAFLYVERK